ncbi:MAG: TPM domain-containing protein [Cyclobacteriaceae bacterium]
MYKQLHRQPLTLNERIIDNAQLFTQQEKDSIFELIKQIDDSVGSQIAVVTIKTLNGQDIKDFSLRMIDSLNLGRTSYRDGLLLTVSVNDQIIRMDAGPGLGKIISDSVAKKINQRVIIPEFGQLNYGTGIYNGILEVKKLIERSKDLVGDFIENK